MKTQPYAPPPGTYDLPFTWAFDASGFADGSNPTNSSIYLQGGYGDFKLRRVVGLNRILAADKTGQFQIQRASKGSYIQSDPVMAENSPELAISPEEPYIETGKIWFDLFGILKPAGQPLTAQLAFQGSRRMKGNPPPRPDYPNQPKSYTYIVPAILTQVASANAPVITKTLITDYDFELHNIILLQKASGGPALLFNETGNVMQITSVAGHSGTLTIVNPPANPGPGGPFLSNQPFLFSVVGSVATVTPATNAGGFISTVLADIITAFNTNVTMSTLGFASPLGTATLPDPQSVSWGAGGGFIGITSPICSLFVYDQNKYKTSNLPILDIFYNGGSGSPYQNGALVPPLFYPRNTILQIDFYSQITNASLLPTQVVAYLVGKKLYPCG
jgi:hypothetical protein